MHVAFSVPQNSGFETGSKPRADHHLRRNDVRSLPYRARALAGLLLVALLLITSGCASDRDGSPTAPPTSSITAEPVWAYPNPEAADGSELGLLDFLLRLVQTVVRIVLPTESAVLEGHIYRLEIPRGALPRSTVYSMTYQASGPVEVTLGPHGAQFAVPVELSIDLSKTSLAGAPDVTLFWWDESRSQWVDVGGVWDPRTNTLTTDLDHFSCYRPGRAGW